MDRYAGAGDRLCGHRPLSEMIRQGASDAIDQHLRGIGALRCTNGTTYPKWTRHELLGSVPSTTVDSNRHNEERRVIVWLNGPFAMKSGSSNRSARRSMSAKILGSKPR